MSKTIKIAKLIAITSLGAACCLPALSNADELDSQCKQLSNLTMSQVVSLTEQHVSQAQNDTAKSCFVKSICTKIAPGDVNCAKRIELYSYMMDQSYHTGQKAQPPLNTTNLSIPPTDQKPDIVNTSTTPESTKPTTPQVTNNTEKSTNPQSINWV